MAEKKGALDGMDISKLRKQAAGSFESDKSGDKDKIRTNPATTENSEIFQWDDEQGKMEKAETSNIPNIGELREHKADESTKPAEIASIEDPMAKARASEKSITKEELGGGIIIEEKPKEKEGLTIGPMAEGSEIQQHVKEAEKMLDDMGEVAKKRMAIEGKGRKAVNTVVEILMDKTGMRSVEFTNEEREKLRVSKKIKVVQVDEHKLKSVKMTKPKAIRQKTLIEKAFSRQFAPFVAAASGYVGKMRNLSSIEIINLITIDERENMNSAEKLSQKASLVWSKLVECSTGEFKSFDDFAKNTAEIDLPVFIYALTRATYPDKETLLMNCGNPECTRKVRDENGRIVTRPNQFNHEYSNTEILLVDRISDKLKDEAERIYQASFTVEDALKAREEAIINKSFRFALGEDEDIIIDVYCPSIYDVIENFERKIEGSQYVEEEVYEGLITTARYIRSIALKNDETGEYDMFDDAVTIIDILARMNQEILEVVQQCITDNIFEYMYRYGFKASSVVCPICGHAFTEDVVINIERLLFLEAQRHMINE